MQKILEFISKQFGIIMITALVIGIIFQDLAKQIKPTIALFLMAAIYLSFLKINFQTLKNELKQPLLQFKILIYTNLLLPILLFLVCTLLTYLFHIDRQWSYGVLLLYAAPTAALGPSLCILLKAHVERATINLILSTLSAPFTIPFLVAFFIPTETHFDYLGMFFKLANVVIIPFIAALITKKIVPTMAMHISPYIAPLSVCFIAIVVVGCVDGITKQIMDKPNQIALGLFLAYLMITLAFIIGWFITWKGSQKDRLTIGIFSSWSNIGLIIYLVTQYYTEIYPIAVIYIILSEISWNTCFIPMQKFIKVMNKRSTESPL